MVKRTDRIIDRTQVALEVLCLSERSRLRRHGVYEFKVTVNQSGVPAGFTMPVPLKVTLPGGKSAQVALVIKQAQETFTINLPMKPRKVELNPDHAVLAHVKG